MVNLDMTHNLVVAAVARSEKRIRVVHGFLARQEVYLYPKSQTECSICASAEEMTSPDEMPETA